MQILDVTEPLEVLSHAPDDEVQLASPASVLTMKTDRGWRFATLFPSTSIQSCSTHGAVFHDIGLVPAYCSKTARFEVDAADAAHRFLREKGLPRTEIDQVWTAMGLHATP